jgi:hypothetical protein
LSELAILIPVLGRPHRVRPVLENVKEITPGARVLFIADPTDFPEQAAVHEAGGELLLIDGGYAAKINAGCRVTTEPYVFTGADDLVFHAGWFNNAQAAMSESRCIGVVGVNDLLRRRRPRHATSFLVSRTYAQLPCLDETRGPMSETYDHSFVDDELIATASHRGAYVYADAAVVEHRHWMSRDGVEDDETYRKGRIRFGEDRALYRGRSHLWT